MAQAGKVRLYYTRVLSGPQGMVPGPDGALWYANFTGNSIGRITTTSQVTTYPAPGVRTPASITAGPGGAMWFGSGNGRIGRITTS